MLRLLPEMSSYLLCCQTHKRFIGWFLNCAILVFHHFFSYSSISEAGEIEPKTFLKGFYFTYCWVVCFGNALEVTYHINLMIFFVAFSDETNLTTLLVVAHVKGATSCPASRERCVQPSTCTTSLPVLRFLSSVLPFAAVNQWLTCSPSLPLPLVPPSWVQNNE